MRLCVGVRVCVCVSVCVRACVRVCECGCVGSAFPVSQTGVIELTGFSVFGGRGEIGIFRIH